MLKVGLFRPWCNLALCSVSVRFQFFVYPFFFIKKITYGLISKHRLWQKWAGEFETIAQVRCAIGCRRQISARIGDYPELKVPNSVSAE